MATRNYHFNLNTENCDLLKQLTQRINHSIRENDRILARLTTLVDAQLRLPNIGHDTPETVELERQRFKDEGEKINGIDLLDKTQLFKESTNASNPSVGSSNSTILKPSASNKHSEESVDDYLRNHLDKNLKLESIQYDEEMFKHTQNSYVRQLLIDNYRLLIVKQLKQGENKELRNILRTYERLITECIIPKLSSDINAGNIEKISAVRDACMNRKFPIEDKVWQIYCQYIENLEQMRLVSVKLLDVLDSHLQNEQMQRLATQVNIVEDLISHLKAGCLQWRK